jgi:hypothetical protein
MDRTGLAMPGSGESVVSARRSSRGRRMSCRFTQSPRGDAERPGGWPRQAPELRVVVRARATPPRRPRVLPHRRSTSGGRRCSVCGSAVSAKKAAALTRLRLKRQTSVAIFASRSVPVMPKFAAASVGHDQVASPMATASESSMSIQSASSSPPGNPGTAPPRCYRRPPARNPAYRLSLVGQLRSARFRSPSAQHPFPWLSRAAALGS